MADVTCTNQELNVNINNRYAIMCYSLIFKGGQWYGSQSISFEFTINADAFISKFTANIDGIIYESKTKEKVKAQNEYNDAVKNDENAILISQPHDNIPNVFKIDLNIKSSNNIKLDIIMEQYLKQQINYNILNIELLNYLNKSGIDLECKNIKYDVSIKDNSNITDVAISNLNNIQKLDDNHYGCKGIMSLNNVDDLHIKYKLVGESEDHIFHYDNNSKTFCHVITNVYNDDETSIIPRRCVFVLDRSGSMSGYKWKCMINACAKALKQLNGYDKFAVIMFDDRVTNITDTMVSGTEYNIKTVTKQIISMKVGGSTNINDALIEGLRFINTECLIENESCVNQMIFITDGQANAGETNPSNILKNVKENNWNNCNIFSFGIGNNNGTNWVNDMDHSLLKLLSLNNNGFYKRIKSNNTTNDLNTYFNILSQPTLNNVSIKYTCNNITFKGMTKQKFNVVYGGNDIIVCGKISPNNDDDMDNKDSEGKNDDSNIIVNIKGRYGVLNTFNKVVPKKIDKTLNINLDYIDGDNNLDNNIEKIWGYLFLQDCIRNKLTNKSMKYNINPLPIALKFGFITPWTSMIVVQKNYDIINPNNLQSTSYEESTEYPDNIPSISDEYKKFDTGFEIMKCPPRGRGRFRGLRGRGRSRGSRGRRSMPARGRARPVRKSAPTTSSYKPAARSARRGRSRRGAIRRKSANIASTYLESMCTGSVKYTQHIKTEASMKQISNNNVLIIIIFGVIILSILLWLIKKFFF